MLHATLKNKRLGVVWLVRLFPYTISCMLFIFTSKERKNNHISLQQTMMHAWLIPMYPGMHCSEVPSCTALHIYNIICSHNLNKNTCMHALYVLHCIYSTLTVTIILYSATHIAQSFHVTMHGTCTSCIMLLLIYLHVPCAVYIYMMLAALYMMCIVLWCYYIS